MKQKKLKRKDLNDWRSHLSANRWCCMNLKFGECFSVFCVLHFCSEPEKRRKTFLNWVFFPLGFQVSAFTAVFFPMYHFSFDGFITFFCFLCPRCATHCVCSYSMYSHINTFGESFQILVNCLLFVVRSSMFETASALWNVAAMKTASND